MHYLIYKITNNLDNKIYVGKHKTEDKNDDYFGSGLLLGRAVEKHGKENFKKEILFECSSVEEMNQKEADIVDEDFIARNDTYNIKLGGQGGFDYINKNDIRSIRPKSYYNNLSKLGLNARELMRKNDEDFRNAYREKLSNAAKFRQIINGNSFFGKKHSGESKKLIGEKNRVNQSGIKNSQYGKHWITNGTKSKLVKKEDIPSGWWKGRV